MNDGPTIKQWHMNQWFRNGMELIRNGGGTNKEQQMNEEWIRNKRETSNKPMMYKQTRKSEWQTANKPITNSKWKKQTNDETWKNDKQRNGK